MQPRLGDKNILTFYQDIPRHNFHFIYLNCQRNYLINRVDQLFQGKSTTMYANNTVFVVHPQNKPCPLAESAQKNDPIGTIDQHIELFLKNTYPKQKHLSLVFNILKPHALFNEHLFFKDFLNIHVADFVSFILNRFCKLDSTDQRFIKLCKHLQALHIKLPKIAVKNVVVHKYLCG